MIQPWIRGRRLALAPGLRSVADELPEAALTGRSTAEAALFRQAGTLAAGVAHQKFLQAFHPERGDAFLESLSPFPLEDAVDAIDAQAQGICCPGQGDWVRQVLIDPGLDGGKTLADRSLAMNRTQASHGFHSRFQ